MNLTETLKGIANDLYTSSGTMEDAFELMDEYGTSMSLTWHAGEGWECVWVTGGKRFTHSSPGASCDVVRGVLLKALGEMPLDQKPWRVRTYPRQGKAQSFETKAEAIAYRNARLGEIGRVYVVEGPDA